MLSLRSMNKEAILWHNTSLILALVSSISNTAMECLNAWRKKAATTFASVRLPLPNCSMELFTARVLIVTCVKFTSCSGENRGLGNSVRRITQYILLLLEIFFAKCIHNDAITVPNTTKKDHDRFHLLAKAVMVMLISHSPTDYLPL